MNKNIKKILFCIWGFIIGFFISNGAFMLIHMLPLVSPPAWIGFILIMEFKESPQFFNIFGITMTKPGAPLLIICLIIGIIVGIYGFYISLFLLKDSRNEYKDCPNLDTIKKFNELNIVQKWFICFNPNYEYNIIYKQEIDNSTDDILIISTLLGPIWIWFAISLSLGYLF